MPQTWPPQESWGTVLTASGVTPYGAQSQKAVQISKYVLSAIAAAVAVQGEKATNELQRC